LAVILGAATASVNDFYGMLCRLREAVARQTPDVIAEILSLYQG
jgi:hypothetical protein